MTCDNELLNLYIDGMLDEKSKREVEAHAADCAACGSALAFLRGYKAAVSSGINDVEPPETLLPSAIEAARVFAADMRRQTAVSSTGRRTKRVNWRAWTTAAAAVVVAVGVSIAVMAWQGVFTGERAAETDAAAEMSVAAYDMPAEESAIMQAAPAEVAGAAEEPAATDMPDEAKASGIEAPAPETASTEEAAPADDGDTVQSAAGDTGAALAPLEIEISPKYFAPVAELLAEQNVPLEADERGNIFTCTVPDGDTATALHKLLKKFGLKVTVAAGQEIIFVVTE